MPDTSPGRRAKATDRKPYAKPTLSEYGRIAELTRAVDFMGKADGGIVLGMRKT